MNALRLLVAGVMVFALSAGARAEKDEKKADNAKMLLGSWEATKTAPGTLPKGAVVEFGKDGKMKVTVKQDGKEMSHEGTYTVDGDKFTIVMKIGDMERKQTIIIKKLTAKELSTEDEKGNAAEFTKK